MIDRTLRDMIKIKKWNLALKRLNLFEKIYYGYSSSNDDIFPLWILKEEKY